MKKQLSIKGQVRIPRFEELLSGKITFDEFLRFIAQDSDAEPDYLHNEERILSIAREKMVRYLRTHSLSLTEEYLWKELSAEKIGEVRKILSNRFRKLLRDCAEKNDFTVLNKLCSRTDWWGVELKVLLESDPEHIFPSSRSVLQGRHRYTFTASSGYPIGATVTVCGTGSNKKIYYAGPTEPIKGQYTFRNMSVFFYDIGILLADLFLMKNICETILEEDSDSFVLSNIDTSKTYIYADNFNLREDYAGAMEWLRNEYQMETIGITEISEKRRNRERFVLLDASRITTYFSFRPRECLDYGQNPFYFLTYGGSAVEGTFQYAAVYDGVLTTVLSYLVSKKSEEVKKAEEYRTMQGKDHARACETKKNIPQKILKQMKESAFNKYFGYVEFDEECDIPKIDLIGKEVFAFFSAMPKIESLTKDNSIRFRKLGNHKAIGLYYPVIHCLCVDLRNVRSFIHELGHLIDYNMDKEGPLSEQVAFFDLLKAYQTYLDSHKKDMSKGKYNINYYKEPTEVFARAFELYVVKIKKYNNSLMPESFDQRFYPENEEAIMDKIKNYFNKLDLLKELSGEELLKNIPAPILEEKEKDGYGKWLEYDGSVSEWFDSLGRAFNSFSCAKYQVPDAWMGKDKKFWQQVSYVALLYLSTQKDTWDKRKQASAATSAKIFADSELKEYVDVLVGNPDKRTGGQDFFYLLNCAMKNEHSTIMQQMASFFMRYLYETDKVFKRAANTYASDCVERNFRFPMI